MGNWVVIIVILSAFFYTIAFDDPLRRPRYKIVEVCETTKIITIDQGDTSVVYKIICNKQKVWKDEKSTD